MGQYSLAEAKPIAAPSSTVAKGAYRLEEAKPLAQDGGIILSPPPSRRDSAGDAAQKSSADLYPTFITFARYSMHRLALVLRRLSMQQIFTISCEKSPALTNCFLKAKTFRRR